MSEKYLSKSLQNLIFCLQNQKRFLPQNVLSYLEKVSYEDIAFLVNFSPNGYTRQLIQKKDSYELMLLCWKKGQSSLIHDHNGSFGMLKVCKGRLIEKQFDFLKLKLIKEQSLVGGHLSEISDHIGCHSLSCAEDAVSLHVYSPPIEKFRVFSPEEFKWKQGSSIFNRKITFDNNKFGYQIVGEIQ